MNDFSDIDKAIIDAEKELAQLDAERNAVQMKINRLKIEKLHVVENEKSTNTSFSESDKIKIFRSLFRGREDVYPKRFESRKTGKSGYQPDCGNLDFPPL